MVSILRMRKLGYIRVNHIPKVNTFQVSEVGFEFRQSGSRPLALNHHPFFFFFFFFFFLIATPYNICKFPD